jgi:hypothetical protein
MLLEPADIAMDSVGWRRVGRLQRLVKVEHDAESRAPSAIEPPGRERERRQAA